jgi:gluconokinase
MNGQPALIVCMGVSGCGKTTIARTIAESTGLIFFEADDFHSEGNRAHMTAGNPLTDEMREPWIRSLCKALNREKTNGPGCALACSALRREHRDRFRQLDYRTLFLFLDGDRDLIAGWMQERQDHFMPTSLLDSQFAALEPPTNEPDVARIPLSRDWQRTTRLALDTARNFLNM